MYFVHFATGGYAAQGFSTLALAQAAAQAHCNTMHTGVVGRLAPLLTWQALPTVPAGIHNACTYGVWVNGPTLTLAPLGVWVPQAAYALPRPRGLTCYAIVQHACTMQQILLYTGVPVNQPLQMH